MPAFKQITIVGLGLIGGSMGMALRRRRVSGRVVGFSRKLSTLREAKRAGAIDAGFTDLRRAVRDADLVVLATPVDTIAPLAKQAARSMRQAGSMLTDVGSTKAGVVRDIERTLPRSIGFLGGHPIAGSEQRGLRAADERLFDGSLCVLTPTARTDRRTLAAVTTLWVRLRARVLTMNPQRHDRLLAGGSHLPHLIAYALAGSMQPGLPRPPRSFADMTRIAQSEPDLWDDIFLSNRAPVVHALAAFAHELERLGRAIARGDRAALRNRLARAKRRRDALEQN